MRRCWLVIATLVPSVALSVAGCDTRPGSPGSMDDGAPAKGVAPAVSPSDRPYGLHLPKGWDRSKPAPLLVFFHGYGSTGSESVAAFGLATLADANGFVLAYPDGTIDGRGRRFWNATNACCDFNNRGVDDVAYAAWLLDDVSAKVHVDPKRIYVAGHSNGGFLALRLACDMAGRIAAVASLAGATWKDEARCKPSEPVSVLQVQGDADAVVAYDGGLLFGKPGREYPGAPATVRALAAKDGCTGPLLPPAKSMDFDSMVPGNETRTQDYGGCPSGINASLWTVAGGSHLPTPTPDGAAALWAWLGAHSKP